MAHGIVTLLDRADRFRVRQGDHAGEADTTTQEESA